MKLLEASKIKAISTPRDCAPLIHALYANAFLFCKGDMTFFNNLMNFLAHCESVFGQQINKEKNTFSIGNLFQNQRAVHNIMGIKEEVPILLISEFHFQG